jgi:hypothetical protein
MKHLYSDFVYCKNNFFNNPDAVLQLAESLPYPNTGRLFPGTRTVDLALSSDPNHQEFVKSLVDKLITEIYTNISHVQISVHFHKYPKYQDQELNTGWIHTDYEMLAGVVYLNKDANDFTAGTSLYTGPENPTMPSVIREEFNLDSNSVDIKDYLSKQKDHNSQFKETIQIGNLYNRLITYDAKLAHKPNNYAINHPDNRIALLFVISDYRFWPRTYKIQDNKLN